MGLVLKRVAMVVTLWVMLAAATVRCGGSTFDDDHEGNRPPVAASSLLETRLGTPVTGRMQATDPDGDPLTFRVVAGPERGSLADLDDSGRFTYIPAGVGTDQFSFRANDGRLDSNTAQVVIRVVAAAGVAPGSLKAAAGGPARGAAAVFGDPGDPGGLLVLWRGSLPALERLPPIGPGGELLAGVRAAAADPWWRGRLAALLADGRLLASRDGGQTWRTLTTLSPPAGAVELALAGGRLVVARSDGGCEPGAGLGRLRLPGLTLDEVCGGAPFLSADGTAWFLAGPPGAAGLHEAGRHAAPLAAGVIRAGAAPAPAGGLWVVADDGTGARLRRSDDGGATWRDGESLPPGSVVDAIAPATGAGALWFALAAPDATVRVWRLEAGMWTPVALLPTAAGRLAPCGGRVCLLDADGRRLWRIPAAADAA